jgi:Nuclease-related domain.
MQIKAADDRQHDLDVLAGMLDRPDVDGPRRRDIEREIATTKAGIAAERAAAYEIELYFGKSANFMTIHDLRIEVGEFSAQIDHLILNRLGEIWVCESKHFAEGVSVNEHGEWLRWWGGRAQGIPSPVEQNRRHMHLLGRVFDEGLVPLPRRFGVAPMRPDLRSLVLVSNNARIGRPRRPLAELDDVIKVEKIDSRVRGAIDQAAPHRIGRVMGKDGLEAFARNLAALHRPMHFDWLGRFGLASIGAEPRLTSAPTSAVRSGVVSPVVQPARPSKPSPIAVGRQCESCSGSITMAEVYYSTVKLRQAFGGRAVCRSCQERVQSSRLS